MYTVLTPFTYYFAGINNIYTYQGEFNLKLTFEGKVSDRHTRVYASSKLANTGNLVDTILTAQEPRQKIICTVPFKILREIRRKAPQQFLFGLAEDEQRWYTKVSILEFRQILGNYELPANLIKNLSQYLRAEDDNLKSLVGFVKTVERYFKRRDYNHNLRQQLSNVSTPL